MHDLSTIFKYVMASSFRLICKNMDLSINILLVSILFLVDADIYLHNPRGSNNRMNEKSAQRTNANRVFDSQVRLNLFCLYFIFKIKVILNSIWNYLKFFCVCMWMYIYLCVLCTCTCVCVDVPAHARACACVNVCTCVSTNGCACTCAYASMCGCGWWMWMWIFVYMDMIVYWMLKIKLIDIKCEILKVTSQYSLTILSVLL